MQIQQKQQCESFCCFCFIPLLFIPAFWSPVKNVVKAGWDSEFSIVDSGLQRIANTNKFLSERATDADKHHVNRTMIYFSDHGLRVTDNGFDTMNLVHSDEFKQNYQVPFLAQWMGISEPRLSQQCAWRDNVPCEGQSGYISFHNKVQSYDDLPDDLPTLITDDNKTGE